MFKNLFASLESEDRNLSVAAAAAFQSFAFHQIGKVYLCSKDVHVKAISMTLESNLGSPLFQSLLGFLHNMSSEDIVIQRIRESGMIKEILDALKSGEDNSMTVDATGLVQNLAREDKSRKILLENNTIDILLKLTISYNIQTQVRAVGAILNLLSPTCEDTNSLKQALSRLIALSALSKAL